MKGTTANWMENQIIIKMLPFRICGILLSTHTCIRPPRTLPIHDYSMQKQLPCWILLLNGQKLCVAIIQYMIYLVLLFNAGLFVHSETIRTVLQNSNKQM